MEKKIDKLVNEYGFIGGESKIIYFLDVDSTMINTDQKALNSEIEKYASKHNIELVWFKKDIEHVMLGEQVENSEKTKRARSFYIRKLIDKVDETRLSVNKEKLKEKQTNVLIILDEYLSRR